MACPLRVIVVGVSLLLASIVLWFATSDKAASKKDKISLDEIVEDETDDSTNTTFLQRLVALGTAPLHLASVLSGGLLLEQLDASPQTVAACRGACTRPSVITAVALAHVALALGMRICPYFGAVVAAAGLVLAAIIEFFSTLDVKPSSGCPYMYVINVLAAIGGNPGRNISVAQPCGDRVFTADELSKHNGYAKPTIHVSIRGVVYDVTDKGARFYGPDGGSYRMLAGGEASRPLAVMSRDICAHVNGPIDDISPKQAATLQQWIARFDEKYTRVGRLDGWHEGYQGRTVKLQPKRKPNATTQFIQSVRSLMVGGM